MKKTLSLVLTAIAIVLSGICHAGMTKEQRIADAKEIIAFYEHRYAPVEWKKKYVGVSLPEITSKLLQEVSVDDMQDVDFYAAVSRMTSKLNDTHNWFLTPSNLVSSLGFVCDYVQGKVLVESVELSEEVFPFKRGDEMVSFDGKPVKEALEDLGQYVSHGNELAKLRILANHLTFRKQAKYPIAPTGSAEVEIFSKERNKTEKVTVEWSSSGEGLAESNNTGLIASFIKAFRNDEVDLSQESSKRNPLETLRWSAADELGLSGASRAHPFPFFDMWPTFVERTTAPLYSGIFLLDGKRIGFIRIPTWGPADQNEWFKFLDREIPYLNEQTDALVIDETDNNGGSICLGERVSRYFLTEKIPSNLFEIRANRHFLISMERWLDEAPQDFTETDVAILRLVMDGIKAAMANGRALTEPLPLCLNDGYLYPQTDPDGNPVVYTKPIVMLVNEWSISAADMTPAPLQDAGRVVMFGARTNGAGGNVETIERLGYSDYGISQTESLTWRPAEVMSPKGIPTHYLENVGVIPDVEYEITVDDFMNGFLGYRSAIDDTLRMLLK